MQGFTSAATSINSAKLPAVYGRASFSAPLVVDYGCGKYTDHIRDHLFRQGRELLPFDPYNQPESENNRTMKRIRLCSMLSVPVDVVCSNVLNVIDDDDTISLVVDRIEDIVRTTGGTAYVTVYEGNRSGCGRQTGPDQYQRNEPLRNYLRFFRNATIKHGMIVVGQ